MVYSWAKEVGICHAALCYTMRSLHFAMLHQIQKHYKHELLAEGEKFTVPRVHEDN